MKWFAHYFGTLAVALLIAACAGSGDRTIDKLDTLTGVTITYSKTPFVFFRDESGKAAFAKNYVHMGPLEVNRMGNFRYYLWLGVWSTVQDSRLGDTRDGFESIVIYADGEPLSLELAGWTPASIGAGEPIYLKPVSSAADAYYEVTIDYLRLIAASSDIRLLTTGNQPQSFELWDEQQTARADLISFLRDSAY